MRLAIPVLFLLAGCATTATPVASGGSKADGVVEMSYSPGRYAWARPPQIDWDKAKADALVVCQRWGYGKTEPFGNTESVCVEKGLRPDYANVNDDSSHEVCTKRKAIVRYQCFD